MNDVIKPQSFQHTFGWPVGRFWSASRKPNGRSNLKTQRTKQIMKDLHLRKIRRRRCMLLLMSPPPTIWERGDHNVENQINLGSNYPGFSQTWLMLSRWPIMMKRTHDNTRKESKSRWKENHEKWRTRKDKRQHPSSLITSWPPHGNLQDWKKHQQLKTHTTEESKMDSKGTLLLLFLHGARWRLDLK